MKSNNGGKINTFNKLPSRGNYYSCLLNNLEDNDFKKEMINIIDNYFIENNYSECQSFEELQRWVDVVTIDKNQFMNIKKKILKNLLNNYEVNIIEYCKNYSMLDFFIQNILIGLKKLPNRKYTINYYLNHYFDNNNFDNKFININICKYYLDNSSKIIENSINHNSNIILNIIIIKENEDNEDNENTEKEDEENIDLDILHSKKINKLGINLVIMNNPSHSLNLNSLILKYCNLNGLTLYIINLNDFQYNLIPMDDFDKEIFSKYYNYNININGKNPNKLLEKSLIELELEWYNNENKLDLHKIKSKINTDERKLLNIAHILSIYFDFYIQLELENEDITELNDWLKQKLYKINDESNITNKRYDYTISF